RRSSPRPGCSTLMTSAPNSPSSVAQKGAATNVARSRTDRPSRARGTSPTSTLATRRLQADDRLLDLCHDLAGGVTIADDDVPFDRDAEPGDGPGDWGEAQLNRAVDAVRGELQLRAVGLGLGDGQIHAVHRAPHDRGQVFQGQGERAVRR